MKNVDSDEIQNATTEYVRSIDIGDIDIAEKVWATSSEPTFIHPRGHEKGWGEIRDNFYGKTMIAPFSTRSLTIDQVAVTSLGEDAALVEFYWKFNAIFREDGSQHKTAGRETQVFSRVPLIGWRLMHIHYSNMPVTGAREGY